MSKPTSVDTILDSLWTDAYNAGHYNARRQAKDQVDFWTNPVEKKHAKEAINRLIVDEYKRGYIQGGIDEILRHDKATKALTKELEEKSDE